MNICLWTISTQKRGQIRERKKICYRNIKAAGMSLFNKCTQGKASVWLALGRTFRLWTWSVLKKLHLEEAMNNSSYYKIAEYLKPWESSKSCFYLCLQNPECVSVRSSRVFISEISVGATLLHSFDWHLLEPYLCDGARLRQQIRPLSLGLLRMVGVALTLEDKHYLPQVWRSTKDKDVRLLTTPERGL